MIKNYIKIAWRNIIRHKSFSFINLVGLTVGLTSFLLLSLYLFHELSFDKFHTKADRLSRVIMEYKIGDHSEKGDFTSTKVFPEFKRQFPEVESGTRFFVTDRVVKVEENKIWKETNVLFADSTFFEVFDFKLLSGSSVDALSGAGKVVLAKSEAKKYFGTEEALGKSIQIGSNPNLFLVSGIVEDAPENSQIQYSLIASISSTGKLQEESYSNANNTTYLLLTGKDVLPALQQKINAFMEKENQGTDFKVSFELERFSDIHLHSPYDAIKPNSSIAYIYIIACVAILVLLIACSTYINLSTARSVERAKEVGVRKIAGAWKSQIFWQFISESGVMVACALIASFVVSALLIPVFNSIAGTGIEMSSLFQPILILSGVGTAVLIAVFAGAYPALVLSSYEPVKVLKGAFKNSVSGSLLRTSLTVFQFVVSIFLIVATFVIKLQLDYFQNKKLGYQRENKLILDMDSKLNEKKDLLRSELSSIPTVKGVSFSYESPVTIKGGYSLAGIGTSANIAITANPVDENFVNVAGIELVAGGNLSAQDIKDADNKEEGQSYMRLLLNESGAKAMGWTPQEAIGKKTDFNGNLGEVKGVVKDFHFASLHSEIKPLVLFPSDWANVAIVSISGSKLPETLKSLEKIWKTVSPDRPFEARFMDAEYQNMYDAEKRTGTIFNIFAIMAIVLACLGLFGLSTYTIRQRIKEIGVRKVLGASVAEIVALLSSNFVKLILVAMLIAFPLAWWASDIWLQQFSYRIDMQWWVFIFAGLVVTLLVLLTISFQTIKAATANPVKSLRTE